MDPHNCLAELKILVKFSISTRQFLGLKYKLNQLYALPETPNLVDNTSKSTSWSTVLKAALRSSDTNATFWFSNPKGCH